MRKILMFLVMSALMIMGTMGVASAQEKVALFLEAPLSFCSDVKVHKMVDDKARTIFTADKYEIIPMADCLSKIQIYREEHDLASIASSGGSYAIPMKKDNVQEIGRSMGADYVFFVRLTNDAPRYSASLISTTAKTTITCDARVLNVARNEYTYTKMITSEGKSTAVYAGLPSFDKAYMKAFTAALQGIAIDTTKI